MVGPTFTKKLLKQLDMSWCLIYVLLFHLKLDMGVVNGDFFFILFSTFQFFLHIFFLSHYLIIVILFFNLS